MFISEYGGDLITKPLRTMLEKGRGDDIVAVVDRSYGSYGSLAIRTNSDEYNRAIDALAGDDREAMMIGVEDPESGSPYIFIRRVFWKGKIYALAVILNASLMDENDDAAARQGSYQLWLGDNIDPERRCVVRIAYSPGHRIEWTDAEIAQFFASL
jgi:hypothetical protein